MPLAGAGGSGGTATVASGGAAPGVGGGGEPNQPEPTDAGTPSMADDATPGSPVETDSAAPSVEDDGASPTVVDAAPYVVPDTTEAILGQVSANCLLCAQMNGCLDPVQSGGTCEMLTGNAASGGLTRAALCRKTLSDIVRSRCDATLVLTKCLCGMTQTEACLTGLDTPSGVAYQDYASELGTDVNAIQADMYTQTFGVGQANSIVDCVGEFGCGCLGE
jgi:hypothetical protein